MRNIKLLDCTLRDGGFINDWKFGSDTIKSIFQRLSSANIDIIEVGFIDERREFDIHRTIVPDSTSFKKIFENCSTNSMVVGMIDYGTCSIDRIEDCKDSILDGIRVIFKKDKRDEAVNFCAKLKDKGYQVFVQPVSITSYSEEEMEQLIDRVNKLEPYAMSIVDTYGLLHKDNLLSYFQLINNRLLPQISIGYHSHNNFQLAYANTIELIENIGTRTLVIDSSVYGMGKSAGNANTELTANFMNMSFGKNYDISQILEIIDTDIMRIYRSSPWGYSLNHYLAAIHDCHPSYVKFLIEKKTLSINAINNLLDEIPSDHKLTFDSSLMEEIYLNYQKIIIDDSSTREHLKGILQNQKLLILGPGNSLNTHHHTIKQYIEEHQPVVITANCLVEQIEADYIFICNAKRYSQLIGKIESAKHRGIASKVIATTNITAIDGQVDYWLNYSSLLGEENSTIRDSALIMLMELFSHLELNEVALAGFDGFSAENNYFNNFYDFSNSDEKANTVNEQLRAAIKKYSEKVNITFVTSSKYSEVLVN